MALLLDGKVMVATIIQSTIVGPKVTISAGDAAQAEALVARLRAHRQSPPSR
jgi:preprotein translocase subunit SecD